MLFRRGIGRWSSLRQRGRERCGRGRRHVHSLRGGFRRGGQGAGLGGSRRGGMGAGHAGQVDDVRAGQPDYTGRLCVIGAELNEARLAELFGL